VITLDAVAELVPAIRGLLVDGGLPPTLTASQVASLFDVGTDHLYSEVRSDSWPTPVLRVGRALRFPTLPALEALGITITEEASA
jgi:hypothetical protein